MKVLHVVPEISKEASGPSYSVPRLTVSQKELGANVELHTLVATEELSRQLNVRAYGQWPFPERFGVSPSMLRGLSEAARTADVLHNHSLWMMPNIYPARAIKGSQCRYVVSPRGTLSTWALGRRRLVKRLLWGLLQGKAVQVAHCLHATASSELDDIRRFGLKAPVIVLPNGIDLPPEIEPRIEVRRKRLLFLGRIHPVKGLADLLKAWREVQESADEWELFISGPDNDGWRGRMEELSAALGNERVCFTGPCYGVDKWRAYRDADLYILPSHSENFGLTVAEALASKTPVIVTKGAPWSDVERYSCGWWPDNGVGPLVETLRQALNVPRSELRSMGERGAQWMERDFSWHRIAASMLQAYEWLIGGGSPPSFVDVEKSAGSRVRSAA